MRALALALITVASLAAAPTALAGTAGVSGGVLTFTADPGEMNIAAVSYDAEDAEYTVTDALPISAGPGCTADSGRAICADTGITAVQVQLGDANDRFDAGVDLKVPVTADGGPGDDDLSSVGNSSGGDGNDVMRAGGRGGDVVDGGPGDDQLLGSKKGETLAGGPGDDELDGTGGADTLVGGEGIDRIRGSASATVDCQGRDDETLSVGSRAKLHDCKTAAPGFKVAVTRVNPRKLATRGMPFAVTCDRPCNVSWELAPDKHVLSMLHHCCLLDGGGIQRDDQQFPLFGSGRQKLVAGVHGFASQKVVKRQKSMHATLTVTVFGRTGAQAQRVVKLSLG